MQVGDIDHADEACCPRQAERTRQAVQLEPAGLQVEPAGNRIAFEIGECGPCRRQVRQTLGEPVLRAGTPQAETPRELLARRQRLLASPRELAGGIGIKGLLACVIE